MVEGIGQAFRDLRSKGDEIREIRGDGPSTSPLGYQTITIDPSSSNGIYFQMAEGEVS